MAVEKMKWIFSVLAILLAVLLVWATAWGQANQTMPVKFPATQVEKNKLDQRREATAIRHVKESISVIEKMKLEPGMMNVMKQAKGLFIMPTYGRFAVGLGGSGGTGILVVRQNDGSWSDPAFFNVGGVNLGVQVGMERGTIGLVLKNQKAIDSFMYKNAFSLNAESGLTIEEWSKSAQSSVGSGDILVWSDAKGLFANAVSIGIKDIVFDRRRTQAYYHQEITAKEIAEAKIHHTQTQDLHKALKFPEPISNKELQSPVMQRLPN